MTTTPQLLRRARGLWAGCTCLLVLAWTVGAQAALYEKGGAFGMGARAMGMAGAYTAVAADETAMWWNPAGLSSVDTLRLDTSLGSLYDGSTRTLGFAAAYPLPAGSAAGFSWQHTYDPATVAINEDTLGFAGSLPLTSDQRLTLGAELKVLFGSIQASHGGFSGLGLDFGLHYAVPLSPSGQPLTLGLCVQDLDTELAMGTGATETVPQSVALGAAYPLDPETLSALDLEFIQPGQDAADPTRLLRAGIEHRFRELVALRAGYLLDNHRLSTFTAGFGVTYAGWSVEYGLLGEVADLGLSHRLSISYALPPLRLIKPGAIATPLPTPTPAPAEYQLELAAEPPVFSPNGDGVADTVLFTLSLKAGDHERIAAWRLTLENAQGTIVRYFDGKGYPTPVVWDGMDQRGVLAPDGTYTARLLLADVRSERIASVETSVRLLTQLPAVHLTAEPAELVLIGAQPEHKLALTAQGEEGVTGLAWTLTLRDAAGAAVREFKGTGEVFTTLEWNGATAAQKLVPEGTYTAEVTVRDVAGNRRSENVAVKVTRLAILVDHEIDHKVFKPGDTADGTVRFRLLVTPAAKVAGWALAIRDAESGRAVTTLSGEGPTPAEVLWHGQNDKGEVVHGGHYFYSQLKVTFTSRQTVAGPTHALASDINIEDSGRALALHLTAIGFEPGVSAVPLDAFKNLQQAADTIKRYAKQYRVLVKGYADGQEAPGRELELSRERAQRVREYLSVSGQIPAQALEALGYGATNPLGPESSASGRAKNRRVEVVLVIQR